MLTKVCLVKAMVFPVVMYGCESWTRKKAECGKIDAFELWCCRRLWRVPWTARRSNLSILQEINPEYSLEGLMLKMKLQYFGHLMWRANLLEKTLMLGKIGEKRRGRQKTWWLDGITDSMEMSLSNLQETEKDREDWYAAVHGVSKSRTWLNNRTTTTATTFHCEILQSGEQGCLGSHLRSDTVRTCDLGQIPQSVWAWPPHQRRRDSSISCESYKMKGWRAWKHSNAHWCDVPGSEKLHLSGAERQNPIRPHEEGNRYPAIVRELN